VKITRLRTQVVEYPYAPPMGLSAGYVLRTGSCVLVFLETDQGVTGEGLVFAFNSERIKPYSMNPRVYEALACGAVVVSEARDEVSEMFPELSCSSPTIWRAATAVRPSK